MRVWSSDAGIGLMDAAVFAVLEGPNKHKPATLNRRHFWLLCPCHVGALKQLPNGCSCKQERLWQPEFADTHGVLDRKVLAAQDISSVHRRRSIYTAIGVEEARHSRY